MSQRAQRVRQVPTVSNADAGNLLRERKDDEFIKQFVSEPLANIYVTTKAQKNLAPLSENKTNLASHALKKAWIREHGACKNDFVKLSGRYFTTYEKLTVLRAQVRKMINEKVENVTVTSKTDEQSSEITLGNGDFTKLIEAIDDAKTRIYKGNQFLFDLYGNAPKKADVTPAQKLENNMQHPRKANREFIEFASKYLNVFKNNNEYLPGRTALKIIYAVFNNPDSRITKNKNPPSQNARRRAPGTSYDVRGNSAFIDLLNDITGEDGKTPLLEILKEKGKNFSLENFNASHLMRIQAYLDDPIDNETEIADAKESINKNREKFLDLYNAGAARGSVQSRSNRKGGRQQ